MSDSDNTTAWVTVAEAAESAHVDSGTVRQWYRSGRIPTRRSEGERGAFLVPLELVLGLAMPDDPPVTASTDDATSAETEAVKAELATARSELEATQGQLEFLRRQLAELSEENRTLQQQLEAAEGHRADLRAQLTDGADERAALESRLGMVEGELAQLRKVAARSSITDNSWLEEATPAYESPVRRQAMAASSDEGPDSPYTPTPESLASDLADLLAATRPDGEDDEEAADAADDVRAVPRDNGRWDEDGDDARSSDAIWTDEAPHPALGHHGDDLFPESDKKGRFGKR